MERGPAPARRAFGRCPHCESRLLQVAECPADDLLQHVGVALLDCYCPECEHHGSVATTTLIATIAYRRETRRLVGLQALADSIAVAAPLRPMASIMVPAEHTPV
jgi:hypothetical protein